MVLIIEQMEEEKSAMRNKQGKVLKFFLFNLIF